MGETHILREVSPFLFNSFHILRLQKQSFFRICERYATLPMAIFRAWATCGVDLPAQVDLTRAVEMSEPYRSKDFFESRAPYYNDIKSDEGLYLKGYPW